MLASADIALMGLVSKFMAAKNNTEIRPSDGSANSLQTIADGALDTLSNVIRVMGNESFPLESDFDSAVFPAICTEFACHVENGAPVPTFDIPASADGKREWAKVRRFFSDRRNAEKSFVLERLQGYRGIVDDLVTGLREIGTRDQTTESSVLRCLTSIEEAVATGQLPRIRDALTQTVEEINSTFAEQKDEYEKQLNELNARMSSLRQDLVAAREEMKRDSLTEAYNRGAFDAAIVQSLNMQLILRQPFTLLMIDLDNFKTINDTWGHAAGDDVLRAVGECLARSFIRKNDLIARFGGDEFAVILADTSAQHAVKLVERFLLKVRAIEVSSTNNEARVSCSVGYTEVTADDSVESVVKRADRALYQAKAGGRDQSAMIDAEPPEIDANR